MTLSGGERQRISLARAFLKDAPILLLDEPTSSVDVATEAIIMEAMFELMQGRTSVMIAHRLGTLDACDAYLQLAEGRIVSTARPEEHAALRAIDGGAGIAPKRSSSCRSWSSSSSRPRRMPSSTSGSP